LFACKSNSYPIWYHYLCWGYPIFTVVVVVVSSHANLDVFGPDGTVGWCFIRPQYPIQRLLTIYMPLGVAWIMTTFFYISARQKVRDVKF
jgi:hypothetical protein